MVFGGEGDCDPCPSALPSLSLSRARSLSVQETPKKPAKKSRSAKKEEVEEEEEEEEEEASGDDEEDEDSDELEEEDFDEVQQISTILTTECVLFYYRMCSLLLQNVFSLTTECVGRGL